MSFYNTQNPRTFRVIDPFIELGQQVKVQGASIQFPSTTNTVSDYVIPAAYTIGGAYVKLGG